MADVITMYRFKLSELISLFPADIQTSGVSEVVEIAGDVLLEFTSQDFVTTESHGILKVWAIKAKAISSSGNDNGIIAGFFDSCFSDRNIVIPKERMIECASLEEVKSVPTTRIAKVPNPPNSNLVAQANVQGNIPNFVAAVPMYKRNERTNWAHAALAGAISLLGAGIIYFSVAPYIKDEKKKPEPASAEGDEATKQAKLKEIMSRLEINQSQSAIKK